MTQGYLYELLDIPESSDRPVAWGINRYARPTEPHFDLHVGLELGIVLCGKSRRIYEGFEFAAEPGQVWFAGLWEPHGFAVMRPRTDHLVLGFLPEFLGSAELCDWMRIFNLPPRERPQARTAGDRRYVLAVARRIQHLMTRQERFWLARLRLILQELLLHFMEQMREGGSVGGVAVADRSIAPGREDLLPVLLHLEKFPHRHLSLQEAARVVHMGRSKFADVFHRAMGVSFARYMQRRRLAGVMRDLRGGDDKLSVLAERWGFTDAPHLVRVFRGVVGQTPTLYRQRPQRHDRPGEGALRMPRPHPVEKRP